ncbi:RNA polymerase sigma factor SigJ [Nocardia speluncae]|uniref:RNA polymerase sigma factor SigJ n=1 Tax=Nocardia speluncae TaxID=419477 RepID=UPI000A56478B|nr:RNA polymerase sigma factor SigJ [Nocardia speluncae]
MSKTEAVAHGTVDEFERQRGRLFGLAYRMLGSATDAEDIVQDAFLRWQQVEPGSVGKPDAWLVKVTTNLCLNLLGSARYRREHYIGPWLPEPVLTNDGVLDPPATAEQRDTVSLGFLLLAERLTPAERAVFVLREAFGYSHGEVAAVLELSDSNCRQLHHRARNRLAGTGQRPGAGDTRGHRELVERFLDAAQGGDLAALEQMLAEDAISVADGGGAQGVARRPIRGAAKVARYLASITGRFGTGLTVSIHEVNGVPAGIARFSATPIGVFVPEIADGRLTDIRIIANPDKIRFAASQLEGLSHSEGLSGS